MRSHRFYCPVTLNTTQSLVLPKEASHHCINVLRYKAGHELILFNGDGFNYTAVIRQIINRQCTVEINNKINPENESPLKVHLYQGIARGEKMDLIIQKSVELGVSEITPLFSERCNVKLDNKRLAKKMAHWQAVSISASEQSGRCKIATINTPQSIKALNCPPDMLSLYLEPTAEQKIQTISTTESISIFVGPEGGFSQNDLSFLEKLQATGIQLGPRILRTETAGLACLTALQIHLGDL